MLYSAYDECFIIMRKQQPFSILSKTNTYERGFR